MADVYCYGHVSTGKILRLRDRYPEADGYGEIVETLENHSGEAASSALVLRRLGVSVALEGNWIGDNPDAAGRLSFTGAAGSTARAFGWCPGYVGATELVISDGATRTVFGRYIDLLFTTKQWDEPDPTKIAACRIACIDPDIRRLHARRGADRTRPGHPDRHLRRAPRRRAHAGSRPP